MSTRKSISIGFASLAVLLAVGAVAWACTPSAYLFPISPSSGVAGAEVTVRGGQFGNGPVELRWASENGRLLTTALGPDFTAKVTIPDKAEGVHYLVAVARDPSDPSKILARRSEAFQITSSSTPGGNSTDSLWGDAGQPAVQETGIPAGALAAVGLGLSAGAMAIVTLIVIKRRKAESP